MSEVLFSPAQLASHLGRADIVVVDCRFVLGAPAAGHSAYLEAHIPGAVYAHLDTDLSGPAATDHGRHPLPPPSRLRELFGRLGIGRDTFVIAYDDSFAMVAARLWWMLHYMGHARVAVLDGGWPAWVGFGGRVGSGDETVRPRVFSGEPDRSRLVTLDEVAQCTQLLDAREPARYRGEIEPLDPAAGHIPGARNYFWQDNLRADGCYLAADDLRRQLTSAAGSVPTGETTHYCGSGVSACHNILAQVVAGLPAPRLYCGSWSEWCRDSERQVMIGAAPGESSGNCR